MGFAASPGLMVVDASWEPVTFRGCWRAAVAAQFVAGRTLSALFCLLRGVGV